MPASTRRRFRGLEPEERQSQRRAQLIQAGIEAFGTRGFQASGVREICAQAKLTERYFYESFKNREALFLAVYQEAVARMEQTVYAALTHPSLSAEHLARVALRATLEGFRSDPRVARILLIEIFSVGTGDASFAASQSFASTIEKVSTRLFPALAARKLDGRLVANGLYGSTIYVAQRWALDGFQEPLEQILDHCALFYEAVAFKMQSPEPRKHAAPNTATKTRTSSRTRRKA